MVSNTLPSDTTVDDRTAPRAATFGTTARTILAPLASLKLTVALLAMAIFVVLAGTLAQVDKDIWAVIGSYFRVQPNELLNSTFPWIHLGAAFVWIDFQLFFPPAFSPNNPIEVPGGFPFPKGWLIGLVMALNLATAHGVRFKVQATGARLLLGLAVIVVGMLITWMVIVSGSNMAGLQDQPWIEWSTLWTGFKGGLAIVWLVTLYALLTLGAKRTVERYTLLATVLVLGGLVGWIFFQGDAARLADSSMRILWQLVKATAASLVLLGGCVLVFKKRAGIVVIHSGIGLMMFSELLVGVEAVETRMGISEGQTINFVEDMRDLELAIVDSADPDQDDVVVIPRSILLAQGDDVITHEDLPCDIQIVKFLQNSRPRRLEPDDENLATTGMGLKWFAEEVRPGAGTDTDAAVDTSSVYVKFIEKDGSASSGTYLLVGLPASVEIPQTVTIGGRPHNVSLRFKRTYKPYSMHLVDVRKDDYMGTDTPRNYSSDVRLVDNSRNVDRQIKIWMNNPLRFAGSTFYQSGYEADQNGVERTVLQVVTNRGWMIPYVSCMIVATGLLAHFWIALMRFLNRRSTEARPLATEASGKPRRGKTSQDAAPTSDVPPQDEPVKPRRAAVLVPLIVVVLCGGWLAGKARPPKAPDGAMNLYEFGKLPIVYQGRVKPLDTLARNSLRMVSGKQTFSAASGAGKKEQPAIRWLLDLVAKPTDGGAHRVIRIENQEVQETLKLKRRKRFRYSAEEIMPQLEELIRQSRLAHAVDDPGKLSVYQRKILELENKIGVYDLLMQSFTAPQFRPDHLREDLMAEIQRQRAFSSQRKPPLTIPPLESGGKWQTYRQAWTINFVTRAVSSGPQVDAHETLNPATESMSKILAAYAAGDAKSFNDEVARYQAALTANPPDDVDVSKTSFESLFNHRQPFIYAARLYIFAFLLACFSWIGWREPLDRASFWLACFTLVLHTYAIWARIEISGRPPVTNLYSSAVFIGWGGVVLALIIEALFRRGAGNVVAAAAGCTTLGIAHLLAGDGDTFVVLQAVLDTQFWLATHVVCITLGYATTFLAGLFGILYILRGVLTPSLSSDVGKDFTRIIYGTLCFAIFFSFVGTVLGGLWADDSWGRFWGWDPKENGALIIVLWNALVLHARWGGIVKGRGLALLAVAGNITTSWSWFGVNELGIGLHSYGFTEGVLLTLGLFILSQLAVIAIGALPQHMWWSLRTAAAAQLAAPAESRDLSQRGRRR